MRKRFSLRLRVTLVCGLLLAVCCLLLTLSHNYYAYEMTDAITAVPLNPALSVDGDHSSLLPESTWAETILPARKTFRLQSIVAMGVIVALGSLMVYYLTGKALAPLHQLDEQIRRRTAADLSHPIPVPASGDEVAGLAVSFNQMSRNLSQAFEQQKRFSQCAAHELRTPLTVLKTRMALFRKKGQCATPETDQLLRVLEEQTQRLSDLVGDLLALTNMDALECGERIDVTRLLSDTAGELQELAGSRGIAIQLQAEPGVVPGNRALLERAVFNLMENAVKYNQPGGTVAVSAGWDGMHCRIEVADEGPGIPQEFRERIYEPFFRIDKSRSRQLGGAGLGLSLVRAIAELHGGRVWVEDAQGGGSRFVLTLPCQRD